MAFDVASGLWLEDRSKRLSWHSSLAALLAESRPDVCVTSRDSPPATTLAWNDRVWDGLRCQVTTVFGGKTFPQDTLQGLRIVFWYPEDIKRCPEGFRWLERQFSRRFGPPATSHDDGEQGESGWQLGDVVLRHEYFEAWVEAMKRTCSCEKARPNKSLRQAGHANEILSSFSAVLV
jgi:hypothetical protein